jgi:ArsR family transcriptional regulator
MQFGFMNDRKLIAMFSALSHPVRLSLFRGLCAEFPASIPSGALAERFDVPPSTMTGHLHALERAGLVWSQRRSRHMMYAVNAEGTERLVTMLLSDVLGDSNALCGPQVGDVEPDAEAGATCIDRV